MDLVAAPAGGSGGGGRGMTEAAAQRRPWIDVNRVTRRFCATMLIFQAIVFVCAAPVANSISGVDLGTAWLIGGGLALVAVVLCALLRFRWAYYAGSALQLVAIGTGFVVPAMFFLGVLFAALWVAALWCGRIAHPHER
ncbi:MAG: DUF4233 domain-containing protein [Streptosporangiales bacterium]|nr:DUF4233 domain-containing protein [Streptosporangiales bacterium]